MVKKLVLVVIGLCLFGFILMKVDRAAIWEILKKADLRLCLACVGTILVMVYLKGVRWSFLLRMQGYRYSIWNCFLIYMGTLFWGNITPGRAGDFMKVLYLKEDLKMPVGLGVSSVLVDRVFDFYLLLVLGGLGILVNQEAFHATSPDSWLVGLVWIFFGLLTFATILAFNKKIGSILLKAVFQKIMGPKFKEKTEQAFRDFHKGMEAFYRPSIAIPILLSLVSYVFFFWGCVLLAKAIGLEIGIGYIAFMISVVNIVSLLSLLGMGTREGALIVLFGIISLSKEQAFAYSMLLLFTGTVIFTMLCFFCFLLKPISWKNQPA